MNPGKLAVLTGWFWFMLATGGFGGSVLLLSSLNVFQSPELKPIINFVS